jgi:hypothetical protein
MRIATDLERQLYVDITRFSQPRLQLYGQRLVDPRDGQRVFVREPRARCGHFVRYRSETAGGRSGGPGESLCHFWAKRAMASSFAKAYGLTNEHMCFEQIMLSGARADVVLHGPTRTEVIEVQLSPSTLQNLERRCETYREHRVPLTWAIAADQLRQTRWMAGWLACRQGVVWMPHCACEQLTSSTSHVTGAGLLDSLALGKRLLSEQVFQIERTVPPLRRDAPERLLGALRGAIRQYPGRVFGMRRLDWGFSGLSVGQARVGAALQHLWRQGELVKWAPAQ